MSKTIFHEQAWEDYEYWQTSAKIAVRNCDI